MQTLPFKLTFFSLVVLMILLNSCATDDSQGSISKNSKIERTFESRSRTPTDNNLTETYTQLGRQRNNPFTVSNMTEAYNILYRQHLSALPITHRYVKFAPTSPDHLALLDEYEISELVGIFDFPLEYELTVAGDEYYDPSVQDSVYTYRYASIPINKSIPSVPYIIISNLVIPPYNSYLTEMAFYIAGEEWVGNTSPHPEDENGTTDGRDNCTPGCSNYPCCKKGWNDCDEDPCVVEIDPPCLPGDVDWPKCLEINPPPTGPTGGPSGDPDYCECVKYENGVATGSWIIDLSEGEDCEDYNQNYGIGSTIECSGYTPPPTPGVQYNVCGCPMPSNQRFPAGCVKVEDGLSGTGPVKIAMVKVKDSWFTSDVTFTNASGCWQINESYYGSMWMWVHFQNPNCKVRAIRKWYFWKALVIVDDFVDRFLGPKFNDIYVEYGSGVSDNESLARKYWASAVAINADYEYRIKAVIDGIPLPRTKLNFLLKSGGRVGGAPMLQNHPFGSWAQLLFSLVGIPLTLLTGDVWPDITVQYHETYNAYDLKSTFYHELAHASHHSLVGEQYWFSYRNHVVLNSLAGNGVYGSFGNFALGSDPDRIALGEALGYYIENIYSETNSDAGEWKENFIPAGLMYDLGDISSLDSVTDPTPSGITRLDNISGFTTGMIYNALTPNINSIRSFRDRLKILSLSSTTNNEADYNDFVDVYDVFN